METRILPSLAGIAAQDWDRLGPGQPFLRHAFLDALEASGSVTPATGWTPRYLTLWADGELAAAAPLYEKAHSFGEFVFDWSWADAYAREGMAYYPKLVVQVPFSPITGPRLLARDDQTRSALLRTLAEIARSSELSSLHVQFPTEAEAAQLAEAGLVLRRAVQFHWHNAGWTDFEAFLASLSRDKRKKIRQERRRVADAGITLQRLTGEAIGSEAWRFFHACYARTYALRGRQPYLNLDFFERLGRSLPEHMLLVLARQAGRPIAASLCLYDSERLYGRYWGAIEEVPCLHFEACYYQPIEFCLERGLAVFEGGAQGEHKLARGFLPVETLSAHWLADPRFHDAVARYLRREDGAIAAYRDELSSHSPFKAPSIG